MRVAIPEKRLLSRQKREDLLDHRVDDDFTLQSQSLNIALCNGVKDSLR
jgi:hypothetical protein